MKLLGILGGLGPLSSAYFYELIIKHTKAERDQDHIDMIISSRATTPDRTAFILGKSADDPLTFMIEDAKRLEAYGADAIVIPCNTAHYFLGEVRRAVDVPVPSIITETVCHLKCSGFSKAAILATEGTVRSESYQRELERYGLEWAIPSDEGQAALMDIIYNNVKRGIIPGREAIERVALPMKEEGCDCAILACTELSLLKNSLGDDPFFVDSLEVLAQTSVKLFGKEYQP